MKKLTVTLLSLSLLSMGVLFAQEAAQAKERACACKDCKCTASSHCGCRSSQGCRCGLSQSAQDGEELI